MECSQFHCRETWRLLPVYWLTSHGQTRAGSSVWVLLLWLRSCHVISGFCCGVKETVTLLGCYTVDSWLPSFFLDCLTLEDGTCRLFWNVSNYQTMLHSIMEEWRSQEPLTLWNLGLPICGFWETESWTLGFSKRLGTSWWAERESASSAGLLCIVIHNILCFLYYFLKCLNMFGCQNVFVCEIDSLQATAVFLNRQAASRYWALASLILGLKRFWNLSVYFSKQFLWLNVL